MEVSNVKKGLALFAVLTLLLGCMVMTQNPEYFSSATVSVSDAGDMFITQTAHLLTNETGKIRVIEIVVYIYD